MFCKSQLVQIVAGYLLLRQWVVIAGIWLHWQPWLEELILHTSMRSLSLSMTSRSVTTNDTLEPYCVNNGDHRKCIYLYSIIVYFQSDLTHMIGKFRSDVLRGTIVRNELCSEHYTTRFLTSLYNAEGEGLFVARELVLGHLQQGGAPSPYDRCLGARLAVQALGSLVERVTDCISDGE